MGTEIEITPPRVGEARGSFRVKFVGARSIGAKVDVFGWGSVGRPSRRSAELSPGSVSGSVGSLAPLTSTQLLGSSS